jgi:hypothetical protein
MDRLFSELEIIKCTEKVQTIAFTVVFCFKLSQARSRNFAIVILQAGNFSCGNNKLSHFAKNV